MHADLRQDHAKEVGPLVGTSSDQEAAVAAPLRDELARGGPLLLDEKLGARLEVVKNVLLVADGPGVAPRGSVLAAAAEVGDGDDAAVPEGEDGAGDGEGGLERDVEACVLKFKEEEKGEKVVDGEEKGKKEERKVRKQNIFVGSEKKSEQSCWGPATRDCSTDPKKSSQAFASRPRQSAFLEPRETHAADAGAGFARMGNRISGEERASRGVFFVDELREQTRRNAVAFRLSLPPLSLSLPPLSSPILLTSVAVE